MPRTYHDDQCESIYIQDAGYSSCACKMRLTNRGDHMNLSPNDITVLRRRVNIATRELDAVKEQLQKAEEQAAIQWPRDIFDNGAIISFTKEFPNNPGKEYTYVAVKQNERWYCTSVGQQAPWTWKRLIELGDTRVLPKNVCLLGTVARMHAFFDGREY